MADVVIQGVTAFMTEGMEIATLLALFLGVAAKLWVGFRKARKANPSVEFDVDYLIMSTLTVVIGASTIVQMAPAAPISVIATASYLAFIFGSGYGINEALNRATIDKAYAEGVTDGRSK